MRQDCSSLAQDRLSHDANTVHLGCREYWSELQSSANRTELETYDQDLSSMLKKSCSRYIFWGLTDTTRVKLALIARCFNDPMAIRAFLQDPTAVHRMEWEGLHAEYLSRTGEKTTLEKFVLSFDFLLSPLPKFLPSIHEVLGEFLSVSADGTYRNLSTMTLARDSTSKSTSDLEMQLSATPRVNDDIYWTSLHPSDPTPRPASDLRNSLPRNQHQLQPLLTPAQPYQEILDRGDESEVAAAAQEAVQEHEQEAELNSTTANSVKKPHKCLQCESSFAKRHLLKWVVKKYFIAIQC